MPLKQYASLVKIGEKIFLSALVSQTILLAVLGSSLLCFKLYFDIQNTNKIITSTFQNWEAEITESIYIQQMVSEQEMPSIDVLNNFNAALLNAGVNANVSIVNCSGGTDELHLSIGRRDLSKCVRIKQNHHTIFYIALLGLALILVSIVLTYLTWIAVRKRMSQQLFNPLLDSITKEANRIKQSELSHAKNQAVVRTSEKVAHDIRSPLTSLEFIVKNIGSSLAEKERITANQALERISDILSTLGGKKTSQDKNAPNVEIIDPLVKRIISEKRLEFKSKNNIEIRLNNQVPYGVFVKISKADFYRTMSNLINNSAEAFVSDKKLIIEVCLSKVEESCVIEIKDNGKGIPHDALLRVLQHGVSFEKKTGSGIGLTSAKETIEKYEGVLALESEVGRGTVVTIKLPIMQAPRWFKTSLKIETNKVCIVDDDDSIHSVWDEILRNKNLQVFHFKSSDEFEDWVESIEKNQFTYLFDLELLGSEYNGLELIEKFNLESQSTLVTSHYDDKSVQEKAQKLGVKIIPKDSASSIAIDLTSKTDQKIVLIDDDKFVHLSWRLGADKHQVDLSTYFSINDFLKDSGRFSKDTAIYVDSNFKDEGKGEIESRKIFDLGFKNINLASGMDFSELPYWIKGNQGKAFPLT